jgi:hypothetical protein
MLGKSWATTTKELVAEACIGEFVVGQALPRVQRRPK